MSVVSKKQGKKTSDTKKLVTIKRRCGPKSKKLPKCEEDRKSNWREIHDDMEKVREGLKRINDILDSMSKTTLNAEAAVGPRFGSPYGSPPFKSFGVYSGENLN